MPIQVVHGNYGTMEQAQLLHQATSGFASTMQNQRRLDQQEASYLSDVENVKRRLDQEDSALALRREVFEYEKERQRMEDARLELEREKEREAMEAWRSSMGLGGDGASGAGQGPMGSAVPGGAASPTASGSPFNAAKVHAALGVGESSFGLKAGEDYESVINEQTLRILSDPDLPEESRRRLAADLKRAQTEAIFQADRAHLTSEWEDIGAMFGDTDDPEWSLEYEELGRELESASTRGEMKSAQRLLREFREDTRLNRSKSEASMLLKEISLDGERKLSDAQIQEIQGDLRRARTQGDVDGLVAELAATKTLPTHFASALRARLRPDSSSGGFSEEEWTKMPVADRLAVMSKMQADHPMRKAFGGGVAPEDIATPEALSEADTILKSDKPTAGKRSWKSVSALEKSDIVDQVRMTLEQSMAESSGLGLPEQLGQARAVGRIMAMLEARDIKATVQDIRTMLEHPTESNRMGRDANAAHARKVAVEAGY